MEKNQLIGRWKQIKGKAREKWGKLSEDDLEVIAGKRDQLLGRLQEVYGWSREQADREVREFESQEPARAAHE